MPLLDRMKLVLFSVAVTLAGGILFDPSVTVNNNQARARLPSGHLMRRRLIMLRPGRDATTGGMVAMEDTTDMDTGAMAATTVNHSARSTKSTVLNTIS